MEVCGGQTHAIVKFGIDELLPKNIRLMHGPGCPVCVTPFELIDKSMEIASKNNVIFCSFGDMLRVPGTEKDLLSVKASGGNVKIVYSPLDSLKIAVKDTRGKKWCSSQWDLKPQLPQMLWQFTRQKNRV